MKMTVAFDPADPSDLVAVTELLSTLSGVDPSNMEAVTSAADVVGTTAPPNVGARRISEAENAARIEASKQPWIDSVPNDVYDEAWRRISAMNVGAPFMRALLDRQNPEERLWREDLAAAAGIGILALRAVTGPLAEACAKEGVRRGMPFLYEEGSYYIATDAARRWNDARIRAGETVSGPTTRA